MPFSDWLHHVTLRGCLIAAVLNPCNLSGQPQQQNQQPTTGQSTNSQAPVVLDPAPLRAILEDVKKIIADEKSGNDASEQRKERREQADLMAQQEMALWAKLMFFAAAVQLIVGVITLLFLWRTLQETRKTAESAIEGTRVAQRALTVLEVPYVSAKVLDSGIVPNGEGTDRYLELERGVRFCFANYGRTPAFLTEQKSVLKICKKGDLPPSVPPNQGGKAYPFGVIVGGNAESQPSTRKFDDFLDEEELMMVKHGIDDFDLFLIGFVKFSDIFGSQYTVGFCMRYEVEEGRFFVAGGHHYNYSHKQEKGDERLRPLPWWRRMYQRPTAA